MKMRGLSEGTVNAIVFYAALITAIVLLALLDGCGKKPVDTPAQLLTNESATTAIYEIPVEQVKDKAIEPAPGKSVDDVVAVVIVPASDKPTTVQVYRRPKTITKKAKEIITGDTGNPDYSVTSDNKGVKSQTGRDLGLWPYIVGLFTLIAGFIAARKWLKRFSWVTKAISVVRRIIGL